MPRRPKGCLFGLHYENPTALITKQGGLVIPVLIFLVSVIIKQKHRLGLQTQEEHPDLTAEEGWKIEQIMSPVFLAMLIALSSITTISGENIDFEREASPITTTHDMDLIDLSKVATIRSDGTSDTNQPAYLCGYDLARQLRGDCGNAYNVDIAPGERWYKFATSEFDMANIYVFAIKNYGEPHLVDITVEVCFLDSFVNGTLHCYDWNEMYGDQTLRYYLTPIVQREIWFHLVAWDEERRKRSCSRRDRTKVEVYMEHSYDSNADAQNPTLIESEGQKFERRVCEINCYLSENLDPLDVFVYEGFAGDRIVMDFGSREHDWQSDHDLKVKFLFETDAHKSGMVHPFFLLDDQYHYDNHNRNGEGISRIDYVFHTSGDLYIWFEALENEEESSMVMPMQRVSHLK